MASYEYNYHTGKWDAVNDPDLAPNTYIVREVPGDEPQQKEIPAAVRPRSSAAGGHMLTDGLQ
jgi:hypothetical protein